MHAALNLIVTLIGIALAFVEQQANFLAAVQIIVYAGAIVILFLFVIMFLGVDRNEPIGAEPLVGQRPSPRSGRRDHDRRSHRAHGAGSHWVSEQRRHADCPEQRHVGTRARSIFTSYLFAFEATARC